MIRLKKTTTNINTLQKQLSKTSADIEKNPSMIYEIKKYNDTVGFFISPQLAQRLFDYLEEVEMMNDPELIESIKESKREFAEGKGRELNEILSEIDE